MDTPPEPGAVRPQRAHDGGASGSHARARSVPGGAWAPREPRGACPRRRQDLPRRRRRPAAPRPPDAGQEAPEQVPHHDADTVPGDRGRCDRRGDQRGRKPGAREHAPGRPVHGLPQAARARPERPRDRQPLRPDRPNGAAAAAPRRRRPGDPLGGARGPPDARTARGVRGDAGPRPPARRLEQDAEPQRIRADRRLDPQRAPAQPRVRGIRPGPVRRPEGVQGRRRDRGGGPVRRRRRPERADLRRQAPQRARVQEAAERAAQARRRLALDRHDPRGPVGRDPPVRARQGQARAPDRRRERAARGADGRDRPAQAGGLRRRRRPRQHGRARPAHRRDREAGGRRRGPRRRDALPRVVQRRADGLLRMHRDDRRRGRPGHSQGPGAPAGRTPRARTPAAGPGHQHPRPHRRGRGPPMARPAQRRTRPHRRRPPNPPPRARATTSGNTRRPPGTAAERRRPLPAPDTARRSTTIPSPTSAPRRPRTRAFGWAWRKICA